MSDRKWIFWKGAIRQCDIRVPSPYAPDWSFVVILGIEPEWMQHQCVPNRLMFDTEEETLLNEIALLNEKISKELDIINNARKNIIEHQAEQERLMTLYMERRRHEVIFIQTGL